MQEILFLALPIVVGKRIISESIPFISHQRSNKLMSSNKPELTFKYVFNYGYNPTYVNGAQGGFSPRGEMVINFYLERQPLPDAITHEITPEGACLLYTSPSPRDGLL